MLKVCLKIAVIFLLTGLLCPSTVHAQDQPPTPPPSTDASVVDQKVNEEARARLTQDQEEPQVEQEEAPKIAPPAMEKSIAVRKIILKGNKSLAAEDLRPILAEYTGKQLTISQLNELTEKLQYLYRRKGYITTLVFTPPQKIENQTVILQALEGKMGKLFIEDNKWFSKWSVKRYWRLEEGDTIKYSEIEKSVRSMNENPDRTVRSILRPGSNTAETDIYLKVKDRFPGHAGFQFDNQGVRTTGKRRVGFQARYNNFILPDGVLMGGVILGSHFGAVYSQYMLPVTKYGTRWLTTFSHSQVAPKREFKGADINGISHTYTTALQQDLHESDQWSAIGTTGFDFKDSATRNVTGTARRERVRKAHFDLTFNQYDLKGSTGLQNKFSFGTKLFGASGYYNSLVSRPGSEPAFFKYEGNLTRSFIMPFKTVFLTRVSTQISPSKLTSQEEFYLGGASTVRGYPEGDYLGDQGWIINLEYGIPFFFIPEDWQLSDQPLKRDLQFVTFFDEGYGRLRGSSITEHKQRHLMGAGAGVRVRIFKYAQLRIDVAHVLGQEPLGDSDHTRLHISFQSNI